MNNNYLYHHGIKGQRWGVRRYQNSDGSLKPAGAKRYNDSSESSGKSKNTNSSKPKMSTGKKVAIGIAVVAASAGIGYLAFKAKNGKAINIGEQKVNEILHNPANRAKIAQEKFAEYNRKINSMPGPETMRSRSASRPSSSTVSRPKMGTSIPSKPKSSAPKVTRTKPSPSQINSNSAMERAKLAQDRLAEYNRKINNIPSPESMRSRKPKSR